MKIVGVQVSGDIAKIVREIGCELATNDLKHATNLESFQENETWFLMEC